MGDDAICPMILKKETLLLLMLLYRISSTLNDCDLMAQMTDSPRQACLFSRTIDNDKVMHDSSDGRELRGFYTTLYSRSISQTRRVSGENGRTDNRREMRQRGGDTEQVAHAGIPSRPALYGTKSVWSYTSTFWTEYLQR